VEVRARRPTRARTRETVEEIMVNRAEEGTREWERVGESGESERVR